MKGRISCGLLSLAISLGASGCVTTQKTADVPAGVFKADEAMPAKKASAPAGPKKSPQAATEIAFGRFKETTADSEAGKGNAEVQARLRDEARNAYQNALKLDPNNLEAQRCLGALYVKTSDFERATDVYKKALSKNPNEAVLWYEFGLCHLRRKDFAESVRCLTKALEIDPENSSYLVKMGFTLAWMNQLDKGLDYLTRAQGAAQAHYNMARILLQRDQTQLARYHLTLALQRNSQMTEAAELLSTLDSPSARN
jgi:tetratricopeptide (TPR) repeat protein